jgi:hypothetical protein
MTTTKPKSCTTKLPAHLNSWVEQVAKSGNWTKDEALRRCVGYVHQESLRFGPAYGMSFLRNVRGL